MKQERQLLAQLSRCARYECSVRERCHVVPGRTDAPQKDIVRVTHQRRFPEAKLVVSIDRRDDVPG